MQRRLLLVGWSAADWRVIHPLMDAGELPVLRKLVDGGTSGTLVARPPLLPPMLWTTAATGAAPSEHGILQSLEVDTLTGCLRPVTSTSRTVPAVWNVLAGAGLRTHVIGWPVTHPAESLPGVVVSEVFARPVASAGSAWPIMKDAVSPANREAPLLDLRLHPGDLNADDLSAFVPKILEIDQDQDGRLVPLAVALAETVTTHSAATWCLEERPWDFAAVHYGLTGAASRGFMRYEPPAIPGVSERDVELYGGVVRAAYRLQDAMLGRLLELAGDDTRVVVMSEHGFLSGPHRRQCTGRGFGGDPWERVHGIFCMGGPDIRQDELVHGARLADIAPTILAAFGIARGSAMRGRVLLDAFSSWPQVAPVAIHDSAPADRDNFDVSDALACLEEMGYSDTLEPLVSQALDRASRERAFNLSLVHMETGRIADAVGPLEQLAAEPSNEAARLHLVRAYLQLGRYEDCEELLNSIPAESAYTVFAHLLRARLLMLEGRTMAALEYLRPMETAGSPALLCLLGEVYRGSRRNVEAERCYRRAIQQDADLQPAYVGLAAVLLERNSSREAMEIALTATGLDYGCAAAHYLLGVAFLRLGKFGLGATSLETCLNLEPSAVRARRLLERVRPALKTAG